MNEQISLALTHYNRFDFIVEAIRYVLHDERIGEIVISDDCSTDGSYQRLKERFAPKRKVKLFRNDTNLDCYRNKMKAVQRSSFPWVILFDSDNVLPQSYLERLFDLPNWDPNTIYCPDFAEPGFDYTCWSGQTVDIDTVGGLLGRAPAALPAPDKEMVCVYCRQNHASRTGLCPKSSNRRHRWVLKPAPPVVRRPAAPANKGPDFGCCLNTANYFIPRDNWLSVWDGSVDPHTADSIFQAYNWLRSGRKLHILPNLRYFHRLHDGSHYRQNKHKTGNLAAELENRLRTATMRPMVIPRTYGRMGNFMFQASCAMAYAWRHGLEYTLPTTTNHAVCNPIYLQHLAKPFDTALETVTIKEKGFPYQELAFKEEWRGCNIVLDGYWQTEKYFAEFRERLLDEFKFFWKCLLGFVSVHVRRTDYLTLKDKHPFVSKQWIDSAMALFPGYHFVFFSDDIEWCKKTYGDRKDVTFSEGRTPEQDLQYMSTCEHQICSASTFSWWGAWLNRNPDKHIVIPRRWFCAGRPEDTRDIVPATWQKL